MIHRHIEETLNLRSMQIHRKNTMYAGRRQHIRHQFRSNGNTGLILPILPRIAEIRHDRRDPLRGRPLCGVDEQKQLDPVIRAGLGALDNEEVRTTYGFAVPHVNFPVRKIPNGKPAELLPVRSGDFLRQGQIRAPGKNGNGGIPDRGSHS